VVNRADNCIHRLYNGHDKRYCQKPGARTSQHHHDTSERQGKALRLAAYIALTCASPAEESAAIEKPALVDALAIVTKPQSQKRRDFI
jgi:hypothetical protein